jgi:PIN domain nuclease of toxin-antitoxin system
LNSEPPAQGYLIDTQAAIFTMSRSRLLSESARAAIAAGPNVLSVVSYWEVMIKSMKGTLDIGDPRAWWFDALEQLAATPLILRPEHIAAVYRLSPIHKDPFDRMLIAQATVEGLALVTTDGKIARYASKGLRVIG